MALTKVHNRMIDGSGTNVVDRGADNSGVSSSLAAFQSACNDGGLVYVPSGTYKLDGKLTLSVDNTCLWLGPNVTLNLSGVAALQSPFGNQIDVTAQNCSVLGSGQSSLLQLTNGSKANAVGQLHNTGLIIKDISIDGDKSNVNGTGFTEDTFGSGVSIVVDSGAGVTENAAVVVDNVIIRNFFHYGVNIYGNKTNGVKIINCQIYDIGVVSEADSVGAGIVATSAVSDQIYSNNIIYGNKNKGIFVSSAGRDCSKYTITGNQCYNNSTGISVTEEANFQSVAGQGIDQIIVANNICYNNSVHGITFGTFNNVGYLKNITVTGNVCTDNTSYGIVVQSNASPNHVSNITFSGNETENNGTDDFDVSSNASNVDGAQMVFTPNIIGTTSSGSATYSSRSGSYIKIGDVVHYQLTLNWTAHTGTGNLRIEGFPYPAANAEPQPAGWVWSNGLTITGQATLGILGNQTYGDLGAINNGTYSALAVDTAANLRISGSYITAT